MRNMAIYTAFIVLAIFVGTSFADCPDAGIRCRIPQSNWGTKTTENGCSIEGSISGSIEGTTPTGTVTIDGKCYSTVTDSDTAVYAVVGSITIGQCYNLFFGGCQPDNCAGNSAGKRCNEQLPGCTLYNSQSVVCDNVYTVQEGDSCWAVANANSMALESLQALNPNVDCDNLQPFVQLCLHQSTDLGPATTVCEGYKYSG